MRVPPRWVVAVSLAVASAILGDSLLYAVLPTIYRDLGLSAAAVGVILSANRLVRLISNPLAGWVVARVGIRVPFVGSVFLAALTTAVYGFGWGLAAFVIARALWGVCWSFLRLGGYLAALDASDGTSHGYYLGFFGGVTRFGSMFSVLVGALLTDLVGFEETVFLFAGITVLGGLAVLRERPATTGISVAAPSSSTSLGGVKTLLQDLQGHLLMLYVLAFLQALTINGLVTSTLGAWLEDQYGEEIGLVWLTVGVATLTGTLLGVRFLSDFLWAPLSGHISDRHGRRRMLMAAGTVEVTGLMLLALGGSVWLTILVTATLFLAATAVTVTIQALAAGLAAPERRSQTMSWYATFNDLGAAAGPLIGWAGISLGLMYPASGALILIVGAVFVFIFLANERPALGAASTADQFED